MFGSALLINPVTTEGATQRTLYLPAGTSWVDFWTGKTPDWWTDHHRRSSARQNSHVCQGRLDRSFWPSAESASASSILLSCASTREQMATSRCMKTKATIMTMNTGPIPSFPSIGTRKRKHSQLAIGRVHFPECSSIELFVLWALKRHMGAGFHLHRKSMRKLSSMGRLFRLMSHSSQSRLSWSRRPLVSTTSTVTYSIAHAGGVPMDVNRRTQLDFGCSWLRGAD